MKLRRPRMKRPPVQPLGLIDGRARSIITTEAATQAWDPRWGLLIAATVGVFVFLLRMQGLSSGLVPYALAGYPCGHRRNRHSYRRDPLVV